MERWFCDNSSTNIHERMQEASEVLGGLFEGNHEGGTVKLFIGEVQEGDNAKVVSAGTTHSEVDGNLPLPEAEMLGIFSVDVQGFGLPRKIKDNAVKHRAQVGRGDRNALCVRHCT